MAVMPAVAAQFGACWGTGARCANGELLHPAGRGDAVGDDQQQETSDGRQRTDQGYRAGQHPEGEHRGAEAHPGARPDQIERGDRLARPAQRLVEVSETA